MRKSLSLVQQSGLTLALYGLLTVFLFTLTLNHQLSSLANSQLNSLGNALATQLTETIKQPLINKDAISIQVILDQQVRETAQIGRIAAYDSANQVVAQSQGANVSYHGLSTLTKPVTMDNSIVGYVRLELRSTKVMGTYRQVLWSTLAIWLICSLAMGYWLLSASRQLGRRLNSLSSRLPTENHSEEGNEVAQLEERLAPLLLPPGDATSVDKVDELHLLAIHLNNAARLQAQLSPGHFSTLLTQLDTLIDNCTQLYSGQRLTHRFNTLVIGFKLSEGAIPQRLASCALACCQLVEKLGQQEGVALEVKCAAIKGQPHSYTGWLGSMGLQEDIDRLTELLEMGAAGEILLEPETFSAEELAFARTKTMSASGALLLDGLQEYQQVTFDQQLAFLCDTLGLTT